MVGLTQTRLRYLIALASAGAAGLLVAAPFKFFQTPYPWYGPGGNPQHTNLSRVASLGLGRVKWSTPVDLFPQSAGSSHYMTPSITAANTVVLGVKTGESDGFRFEGRSGVDGSLLWTQSTDYSIPPTSQTFWTSVYPISLVHNSVVGAGAGGTVFVKDNADDAASAVHRYCFYQKIAAYDRSPSTYDPVKICTPIMGSSSTNFFFGYATFGTLPSTVTDKIGTGGVAKMTVTGGFKYKKASDMVPSNPGDYVRPAFNSCPVRSNDGTAIYEAVCNVSQGRNYLVKLDVSTLNVLATVHLVDPNNSGEVWICPCSSASPMVAPDGQVFYGVLRNNDGTSHGWMLQFDGNLSQTDSSSNRFPVGAFGWDDTPSVVPANLVKSYTGSSAYLLLTKYNNYKSTGGNGRNRLAVLDPKHDNVTVDPISGLHTMNEVITILGVTCDDEFYSCTASTDVNDPSVPIREWCINSAAIDKVHKCAIVNSEDGHAYKWDFTTNRLVEATALAPATGEPYTPTVIGPDGTSYAINKAALHALVPNTTP